MSWYKWKKIEVICWFCNHLLFVLQLVNSTIRYQYLSSSQVPLVASNRIGKEVIQTEHGDSEITFYGNSFIAGNSFIYINFIRFSWLVILELAHFLKFLLFPISFFSVTGPTGEIIATADDKTETVVTAEFDLDKIKSKRHSWGVFRDRRPELYKVLLTLDGTSKWASQLNYELQSRYLSQVSGVAYGIRLQADHRISNLCLQRIMFVKF